MAELECSKCGSSDWGLFVDMRRYFSEVKATIHDGLIDVSYDGWGDRVEDLPDYLTCQVCEETIDLRAPVREAESQI